MDQCCDIIPIYKIMNHFEIGYSEYMFPYKWFTYIYIYNICLHGIMPSYPKGKPKPANKHLFSDDSDSAEEHAKEKVLIMQYSLCN